LTLILNGTDNSATTPAVTGTDTDTGVYYPAANQVALATNGTLALIVDASQNVGVGTASPASFAGKVVVNGGLSLLNSSKLYLWSSTNFYAPSIYAPSESIAFTDNNGVETFRVGSTGVLTLKGGSTSATGVGITFPATQSASSDANTLDDYEEGTFTITLTGNTGNPTGVSYVQQLGKYTKVGNLVTVFVYLAWTTYTGGSGSIQVSGLPFSAVSTTNGGYNNGSTQISNIGLNSGYTWASVRTLPSQSLLDLQQQGSGNGWTTIPFGNITSSATAKEILATVTYFTST
jgi:hypothetical protein